MASEEELKKIKKIYGERFMKLCRSLFPTILEKEGRLTQILSMTFSENCADLYDVLTKNDLIDDFKDYIYNKIDVEDKEKNLIPNKTPYELLDEAGYTLTECTTDKEIQEFRKYYAPHEELCTFYGDRLQRCVVFWAVKKDAEKLERNNFINPKREDEYGTSVMSIQFNKQGISTVSIKNRYNHSVNNPDATYGNDLDKIVPGLAKSFERLLRRKGLRFHNINIEELEIPGYVVADDGKYYKYNNETMGIYYCPGNIIIDNGRIIKLENPEKEMLIDYFILNMQNKTLKLYDKIFTDAFIDEFKDINKIQIVKNAEKSKKQIIFELKNHESPVIIEINKNNEITGYINNELKSVKEGFLRYNEKLEKLELANLEKAGDSFLEYNKSLTQLEFTKITQIGSKFLCNNKQIKHVKMPNLVTVKHEFISRNEGIKEVEFPKLTKVGAYFLGSLISAKSNIEKIELPELVEAGNAFLYGNTHITKLELPNLVTVGDNFLSGLVVGNRKLQEITVPKLTKVGCNFLSFNKELTKFEAPNLKEVDDNFLALNTKIKEINLPNLVFAGADFLRDNISLEKIIVEKLREARSRFLENNIALKEIYAPKLSWLGNSSLRENQELQELNLPSIESIESDFLCKNKILRKIEAPLLKEVGYAFLESNQELRELNLPSLESVGRHCLEDNQLLQIEKMNLPKLTETDRVCNRNILFIAEQNASKRLNSKIIAELDKNNQITTSEIETSAYIIKNKIISINKEKTEETQK